MARVRALLVRFCIVCRSYVMLKLNAIRAGFVALVLSATLPVFAAGSTEAVAAITAAQTDALAVAAGLVGMGVAIWGAMYLYRKFFK